MLSCSAFELAEQDTGVTIRELATELARSYQAVWLWRTCTMPCRQGRSGIGCRPGTFSGTGDGSSSISAHKSSTTIDGRVLSPSERPNHRIGHTDQRTSKKMALRALTGGSLNPAVKIKGLAGGDRVEEGLEFERRVLVGPCSPPAAQGDGRGEPGADGL